MQNKIKNEHKYKLICILLYLIIDLSCLLNFLIIYPRYLLFNEKSEEEKIKLNLYKNFAKNIYENINTPLIKNLTLTNNNEGCPDNFNKLIFKNQYYGNFSKIYGNKSICIERLNNSEYTYRNLLKVTDYDIFKNNKRKCGNLAKDSNLFLYVSNQMMCPLNHIEINSLSRAKIFGNYYYQMAPGDIYLTPIYGNNPHNPVITNIEIVNNYKVCVERHKYSKEMPCEFPDNNQCFINDNYEQIYNLEQNDDNYNLNIKNILKWNFPNIENITKLCNKNLKFHIFAIGYINFTEDNLKKFEREFPSNDLNNNPLSKAYRAYKSPKNIDRFLCLISLISLLWSLSHFCIQIMVYLDVKGARKLYIINGLILFLFKLLFYFGIIINYFYFLNKIQKVYLIMVDKARNKILEYYTISRQIFIAKIVFICLQGFLVICIDFIIFIFTYIIKWGQIFKNEDKKYINKPHKKVIIENGNIKASITTESPPPINYNPFIPKGKEINSNDNQFIQESPITISSSMISENSDEIILKFIFKNDIYKSYLVKTEKSEPFENAIQKLKNQYSELKEKNMKIFINDSNIINKKKTINQNSISSVNNIIYIQ